MKVLWFTNTPANADEFFNSELKDSGGWLKALDQSLQNHVELHIAFYGKRNEVFKYKETFYHSIKTDLSLYKKLLNRITNKVLEKEDLFKYMEIIKKAEPDIIHIHGTENSYGCIATHTTIPIVVSIQGNMTVYLHKYLSGFERQYLYISNRNTSSLKDLLFPHTFLNSIKKFRKMQIQEENNLKHVKFIIGRTEWDKRITRVLSTESEYFIGDEILRKSFYNYQWSMHTSKKTVIHTTNGNFLYKGFENLCLTLFELNKIGFACEWQVAGISEKDLIVKLTKRKLKDKFPRKGLILLGNLNEKELIENMLRTDIYVMVSHIENSPNNLCEAMILGMPCISTFVGGVGSLIRDGKDGILIQDSDPWVMAGAIIEMAVNKEKAIRLGINGRKTALKRHDRDRIISDLLKVYENILIKENNDRRTSI